MSYMSGLNHTGDAHSGFERLRVDVAQTGFFEGREFRSYKELNIATGATYVIKAVAPINIILFGIDVAIESGYARIGTYVTGTEGGSYSDTLPVIGANTMTLGSDRRKSYNGSAYAPQVLLTGGGTHTGGVELDVIRLKAANVTAQSQTVGNSPSDERGVSPGTFYFRIENLSGTDSLVGVFRARWEERPVGFFNPT